MPEGAQLAVGSESPERLTLEDAVLGEVVQDTRFEAEEAAVDPALDLRFLVEAAHQSLVVQIGDAELELWPDHRHRRQAPGLAVHASEGRQVDVRDPIRIGGGEGPLPDVVLGGLEAAACWSVEAGVDAAHLDPLGPRDRLDPPLDLLALVSGEQQKAREALRAVDRDHVPEDRAAADLDERFGDRFGAFTQAGTPPPAEDHDWVKHSQDRRSLATPRIPSAIHLGIHCDNPLWPWIPPASARSV